VSIFDQFETLRTGQHAPSGSSLLKKLQGFLAMVRIALFNK
jgi:hypothetical protein